MNLGYQPVKNAVLAAILSVAVLLYPLVVLLSTPGQQTVTPAESINYALMDKSGLNISMKAVMPGIQALAADTENTLAIRVQVINADGTPVHGAEVRLEASASTESATETDVSGNGGPGTSSIDASENSEPGITSIDAPASDSEKTGSSVIDATNNNTGIRGSNAISSSNTSEDAVTSSVTPVPAPTGSFYTTAGITDSTGSFVADYVPPSFINSAGWIKLTSRLVGTDKTGSIQIKLIPVPVVFVHGYQASPEIFSGISAYLKTQGFDPFSVDYASEQGVVASSEKLSAYLDKIKTDMASSGIQVKRFDLITHSMGGLVARYYTCSSGYSTKENVRKLLFLSVPQRGSPFASIGLKYYNDQGIRDLLTDSSLYSAILPSMTNGGLNPSIQTGSIMGRYDEVVSAESASLAEWNIKTELFDVGDSNFTIDKLLSGEILQAANHKLILYNKKVYQRVKQMLITDIPYPSTI